MINKTLLTIALASSVGVVLAEDMTSATFDMYDPTGALINTDTAVTGAIGSGAWSVQSTATFYGQNWTAHNGTTFGPGTYTIDTVEGGVYTIAVGAGQVGGHILFDWGVTSDIDVVNVWGKSDDGTTITYISSDINSNGTPGIPMIDGPFAGFSANFDFTTGVPPLPPLTCENLFVVTNTSTAIDIGIATQVLSTCINAQGDLTLGSYTQPTNGVVTDDGTNLTYTPNDGFSGLDSFDYTADDTVLQDTATITVQVGGELQGNFTMLDSAGDTFGGTNDIVFTFGPGVDPNDPTTFNTDESDTNFGKLTIISDLPQPFNGFIWDAHNIRIFGPGDYAFDTGCTTTELENTGCPAGTVGGKTISMHVGTGQIGAHILFDWSSSTNIDVVNVWSQNEQWDRLGKTGETNALFQGPAGVPAAEDAIFELVSTDVTGYTTPSGVYVVDGNGLNGAPMVDGPFEGFFANFSNKPDKGTSVQTVQMEASDTKLGSGILASLDLYALLFGMMSLIGLRHYTKKQ